MQGEAPPPSTPERPGQIPAAVDAIILKMVQKDREHRFADAADLARHIAETPASLDTPHLEPRGRCA